MVTGYTEFALRTMRIIKAVCFIIRSPVWSLRPDRRVTGEQSQKQYDNNDPLLKTPKGAIFQEVGQHNLTQADNLLPLPVYIRETSVLTCSLDQNIAKGGVVRDIFYDAVETALFFTKRLDYANQNIVFMKEWRQTQ